MSTETVQVQDLRAGDRVLDAEGEPGQVIFVTEWTPLTGGAEVEVMYGERPGDIATAEDSARYPYGATVERVVA